MKRLLIVQNVPTQFDVPLYNKLAQEAVFALTVIYTQTTGSRNNRYDAEIGRAPQWDHITAECYERIDLSAAQAGRPADVVALIAAKEPDLVLISGYYPALHRKLVLPLKKLRLRVGLRSDNTLWHSDFSGIKGLVKKLVLPIWLRRYDTWHPVGTLAQDYLETVSRAQRPTFLFPYNVDNTWFAQQSGAFRSRRNTYLEEMGLSPQHFIVLGIMKWHQREDPLVLVRAFRQLLDDKPEARLILVGDGPLRAEVKAMIGDIVDKVCLPGYAPYSELPKYYALADVFVHPAASEPWGVSVNEAMACGVPVVVSSGVGAATDLVVEGETGFVFRVGDSAALARTLADCGQRKNGEAMRNACIGKIRDWSYAQTQASFERAVLGA
ncbi:MAG: glycosyltransferase family 4 protein [Halioglobus sp.]|nr:glycosyltransferase family 4 protein [Halioglobus sp.]